MKVDRSILMRNDQNMGDIGDPDKLENSIEHLANTIDQNDNNTIELIKETETNKDKINNVQTQLDQMSIKGEPSLELGQARVNAIGKAFTTVKARLDDGDAQLAEKVPRSTFESSNSILINNLNEKRNKTELIQLNDLDQEVKTAITGGSVAVVGANSVGESNIINDAVKLSKLEKGAREKIGNIFPLVETEWSANRFVYTIGQKDKPTITTVPEERNLLQNPTGSGIASNLISINDGSVSVIYESDTWAIVILEYDINQILLKDSGWLTASLNIEYPLQSTTRYIRFAAKKRNDSRFFIDDIKNADVKVIPKKTQNYNQNQADAKNSFNVLFERNTNENLVDFDLKNWVAGSWNATYDIAPVINASRTRIAFNKQIKVIPNAPYVLYNYNAAFNVAIIQVDKSGKTIHESGGWITTPEYKFMTTMNTVGIYISVKKADDTNIWIGDAEKTKFKLELSKNATGFKPSQLDMNNLIEQTKNTINLNIVRHLTSAKWEQNTWGGDIGSTLFKGTQTNRIRLMQSSHFYVKPNTTYIAKIESANDMYRLAFIQITNQDIKLHDSGWKNGIYKFTTEPNADKIVLLGRRQDDGANITPDAFNNIVLEIYEVKEQPREYKTNLFTPTKLRYIGHRGLSSVAPENTIPAVVEAGKSGYWGAEVDVGVTLDGQLILMHDDTVDRTTNGYGRYADMTLDQIKSLTVDTGPNIENYPNLKVPTFKEYLIACKKYGLVPTPHLNRMTTMEDLRKVYDEVVEMGFEESIIIHLDSLEVAQLLRKLSRKIYIVIFAVHALNYNVDMVFGLDNAGIGIDYTQSQGYEEMIKYAHKKGVTTFVYTVDDPEVRDIFVNAGIDCVMTNGITF